MCNLRVSLALKITSLGYENCPGLRWGSVKIKLECCKKRFQSKEIFIKLNLKPVVLAIHYSKNKSINITTFTNVILYF